MAEEAIRNPRAGMKTFRTPTIVGSVLCIAMLLVSCMMQAMPSPGAHAAGIEGLHLFMNDFKPATGSKNLRKGRVSIAVNII
jgi:hypothetical protein